MKFTVNSELLLSMSPSEAVLLSFLNSLPANHRLFKTQKELFDQLSVVAPQFQKEEFTSSLRALVEKDEISIVFTDGKYFVDIKNHTQKMSSSSPSKISVGEKIENLRAENWDEIICDGASFGIFDETLLAIFENFENFVKTFPEKYKKADLRFAWKAWVKKASTLPPPAIVAKMDLVPAVPVLDKNLGLIFEPKNPLLN